MPDSWVITFDSVYYVMKAERILREKGIGINLIPTPREISSDCGVAIELVDSRLDLVKEILQKNGLGQTSFVKLNAK